MTDELIEAGDRVEITWCFSDKELGEIKVGKVLQMPRGSGDLMQVDMGWGIMAINPHFWALQHIRKLEDLK